jgi:hypothetical protein
MCFRFPSLRGRRARMPGGGEGRSDRLAAPSSGGEREATGGDVAVSQAGLG